MLTDDNAANGNLGKQLCKMSAVQHTGIIRDIRTIYIKATDNKYRSKAVCQKFKGKK